MHCSGHFTKHYCEQWKQPIHTEPCSSNSISKHADTVKGFWLILEKSKDARCGGSSRKSCPTQTHRSMHCRGQTAQKVTWQAKKLMHLVGDVQLKTLRQSKIRTHWPDCFNRNADNILGLDYINQSVLLYVTKCQFYEPARMYSKFNGSNILKV